MAANTDKFKKTARKWVGQIGAGGVSDDVVTTIPLSSATNLPTDTAVVAVIDRVNSAGTKTPSTEETVIGVVSGSNLTSCTRGAEGTAQAHSAGAVVEILWTNKGWNDVVDGLLVAHNQDGTHKSGSVLTLPQINDTSSDHQYVFSVCELTADRTVALPLLTGNDEFVFKDHTQTLTNKTHNGDFKLAGATDNIQVNSADPKRGMYVPAAAMFGATTSGAAGSQIETSTNKINTKVLDFDGAAEEYAWFSLPSPDYWDLSTITVKFHWTAASGSGDVIWGAAALARSDDDALDTALGTAVTVTDTLLTANDQHTTAATSAITVGGTPAKGDYLYVRVYRDADAGGDTLNAVDARLIGVTVKFGISQYDDQ